MFKFIGGLVVYGLALYGLIEGLDQMTHGTTSEPTTRSMDEVLAAIKDLINRHGGDGPTPV